MERSFRKTSGSWTENEAIQLLLNTGRVASVNLGTGLLEIKATLEEVTAIIGNNVEEVQPNR